MKKSHIAAWLAAAVLAGSLMAGCGDTQTTQPKSSAGSAEQGKEYLLFLTASGEDNTYCVTGAMQGAYEVQADGTCVAWNGTKWTLQDAQKVIEQAK